MALVLETGEGLADAESLVSLAEVRAFAASRGLTLPASDTTVEQQIRIAHDYLLNTENRLQGTRRVDGQALPFPRNNVNVNGYWLATGTIPTTLKNALAQLVVEAQDRDALPPADGRVVISESVGPISTTYAQNGVATANPSFPRVDAFLRPLLQSPGVLQTIRV